MESDRLSYCILKFSVLDGSFILHPCLPKKNCDPYTVIILVDRLSFLAIVTSKTLFINYKTLSLRILVYFVLHNQQERKINVKNFGQLHCREWKMNHICINEFYIVSEKNVKIYSFYNISCIGRMVHTFGMVY